MVSKFGFKDVKIYIHIKVKMQLEDVSDIGKLGKMSLRTGNKDEETFSK